MAAAAKNIETHKEQLEKLIIVTGFGPFAGHEDINASWEAVRRLPDEIVYQNTKYILQKIEIPVEYEAVDEAIENIWSQRPTLVIHCGVHGGSNCINVEKLAYNNNFVRKDYSGKHLSNGKACLKNCPDKKSALFCRLDLKKVIEVIGNNCQCTPELITSSASQTDGSSNETNMKIAKISKEVGNYLCGYIYLKSLDRDCNRSLFIHVPPLDKPFNAEKLSEVVLKITEECLRQVVNEVIVYNTFRKDHNGPKGLRVKMPF